VIRLPPLLLIDSPGVGKTQFISALAKIGETNFYSFDFSTVSSGCRVTGGHSSWSESKLRFISESIKNKTCQSNNHVLDELDKVASDQRVDPLGGFYSLSARFVHKDDALLHAVEHEG
tara:strand:- start:119273 stop:119626 length:354 start_codon:yes stop_codon:yes gene_type:complete